MRNKLKNWPYFCDCGCGEICNRGKRFISGHNSKISNPFLNKNHSEETKIKMKNPRNFDFREKCKEVGSRPEIRKIRSETNQRRVVTKETREKMSFAKLGRTHTEEHNLKIKQASKHRKKSVEEINKIKLSNKVTWSKTPDEIKEIRVRKIIEKSSRHPNDQEKIVHSLIIKLFPEEFIYSGNGKIIIGGKCPDWFNVNGKKQVIEFFGEYCHGEKRTGRTRKDEENQKLTHYKQYGYDCLIIWGNELSNLPKLENKIEKFVSVT